MIIADNNTSSLSRIGRSALSAAGVALLLFIPAGTWRWPGGWIFVAEITLCGLATELWLARHDPALLAERRASLVQPGQAGWDRLLMSAVPVLWLVWLPLMALDAVRLELSEIPVWARVLGAL